MRNILVFFAAALAATSVNAHPHPGAGNVVGTAHDMLHLLDGLAVALLVAVVVSAYAGYRGIRLARGRLRLRADRRK